MSLLFWAAFRPGRKQVTPLKALRNNMDPLVTPWADPAPPTQSALWRRMTDEGLNPYSWSNGPFEVYTAHSHAYNKVIYVVQGNITFGLPELGKALALKAGDRLDLPAGIVHDAQVGAQGVVCLEAHQD